MNRIIYQAKTLIRNINLKKRGYFLLSRTYRFIKKGLGQKKSQKLKALMLALPDYFKSGRSDPHDLERLTKLVQGGYPLRLHFGCHARLLKGWINIDLGYYRPRNNLYLWPDPVENRGQRKDLFVINFSEGPLPLPDNSVEVIFHEDFLEHLDQRDTLLFLAETFRVLKKGGVHRISTPDLAASMRRHSKFSEGFKGVFVYEWDKHAHLNIPTPAYLKELALLVGYSKALFTGKNQSCSPLIPLEFRPNDREENEQIFCDLIK
jgi:hypothetical protein